MELYNLPIHALQKMLARGEISAVELTAAVFARIDQVEGKISAYISLDRENARKAAEQADRRIAAGQGGGLCGIPISIKDAICTKGLKTTGGSRILESFVPPYDATVIAKLKEQGAVITGKVCMDEFAMGSSNENCAFGIPRNPWNPAHICGGLLRWLRRFGGCL